MFKLHIWVRGQVCLIISIFSSISNEYYLGENRKNLNWALKFYLQYCSILCTEYIGIWIEKVSDVYILF